MVKPLRPLRFWRPLRRPVLSLLLRYDRSGYAHRFLMWCTNSAVSNLGVLGRRTFYLQTCFAASNTKLDSYFTRFLSRPSWPLKSLSNGVVEIWCFSPTKGASNNCCNDHREIAVSSVPGKLLHRWRRALVMPGLMDIASETQCGGLAGRATDVASHLLRQTVEHHRARKRSTIIVFVDVIAAFYNVVRSLITDNSPLLQDARHIDDGSCLPSARAVCCLMVFNRGL